MNDDHYKDNDKDSLNYQNILIENINNYFSLIKEENEILDNKMEEINSETIIKNNNNCKSTNFNDSKKINNKSLQENEIDFNEKNKNTSNNNKNLEFIIIKNSTF